MDGYDIQKYLLAKKKAKSLNIILSPQGGRISLKLNDKEYLGVFNNVNDCYNYLCGYEVGFSKGRRIK